jgi:ATP-dependent DNA ligase
MSRPVRKDIMLAYPLDPGRVQRLGAVFALQPKFKGERCRIEWFHSEPIPLSSYGNEFKFINHITEALQEFKDFPFDGELYKHGWSQGRINSAANRKVKENPDSKQLEYHIYDLQFPSVVQRDRLQALTEIKKLFPKDKDFPLKISPCWEATKDTWLAHASHLVDKGYEGVILRNLDAFYVCKKTVGMIKFKPTEVDTYIITDVLEAVSKEGKGKNTLGAFFVRSRDETVSFKVGAGKIKHAERKVLWEKRELLISRTLEVKHELTKTEKGIPDCALAVRVI